MDQLPSRLSAGFITVLAVCLLAGSGGAMAQTTRPAATLPTTLPQSVSAAGPRQAIEDALPLVTGLLLDRATPAQQRAERLRDIIRQHVDFHTLARIMVGQTWDTLPQKQRDEFVDVFGDYLMGVYLPLMNQYNGQRVHISQDYPVGRADHMVITRVADRKAGGDRQVALIAFRMRQGAQGWKAIDVTVEGISIARVFGAQFQPVLARDGMDGLLKQLRQKIDQDNPGKTPAQKTP